MKKAAPKKQLSLDPKNYVSLFKLCFFKPSAYAELIPDSGGYKYPIIFFLGIYAISSFIGVIIKAIATQTVSSFFLGVSQIVFSLPFALLSLIILAGIFYLIAKLLGGQGSFEGSLRANAFATLPFIFASIPVLSYITDLFYIYLLVLLFAKMQHLSKIRSALTIIPVLVILLVLGNTVGVLGQGKV